MCLPACLWAHMARSPFNYTIIARTLLEKCDDYQFQRSILQFPVIGKNYRIASMFIITRALSTPRLMSSEEKVAPCFVRQNISWSSNESSRKHENIALKSTMTKQWNSLHFTREFVCTTYLRSIIWYSQMFDGFSHDNIVKIKLPRQTQCKHEHRWLNLITFQFWERLSLRSQGKTTNLQQSVIFLNE